jgi:hypothetical protein
MSQDRPGILKTLDTETKVLGLIALIAEALFLGALTVLREKYLLYALFACVVILLVTIIGIVIVNVARTRVGRMRPSALTPRSDLLNGLIDGAIETVCRAVSLPNAPLNARLRVFIFRKERNQLVCSHFWSDYAAPEKVGRLRFELDSATAKRVVVVRAVLDDHICRTPVSPLPPDLQKAAGDVAADLDFVVAAPIRLPNGEIWGSVDFDTSTEEGKALLSHEMSNRVMSQLASHLGTIFDLERQQNAAMT